MATPGLEPVVVAELAGMGVASNPERGGVAFESGIETLYDASLRLRAASRLLVRIARFRARTFWELERHASRVDWDRWLGPGPTVELRVSSTKSKLYHEGAIAERLAQVLGRDQRVADSGRLAETPAASRLIVRAHRDAFTISADASGERLHRRGYRLATARAPLRETLAAAMLLSGGWPGDVPFLDPLCGSGTIPIEAALLARRVAPGLASADREPRAYAFMDWPDFDASLWHRVVARAQAEIRPAAGVGIVGSDRDAGAIEAARANARRAGVAGDVEFDIRPLSAALPPAPAPGWLVTNPPYGVRVGEQEALRDLYATLGRLARTRLPGWTIVLLSANRRLDGQTGLELSERLRTRNGGIPVRLLVARVPAADGASA